MFCPRYAKNVPKIAENMAKIYAKNLKNMND